jgi:hypothetical protein
MLGCHSALPSSHVQRGGLHNCNAQLIDQLATNDCWQAQWLQMREQMRQGYSIKITAADWQRALYF